jgi:hypothetical protein
MKRYATLALLSFALLGCDSRQSSDVAATIQRTQFVARLEATGRLPAATEASAPVTGPETAFALETFACGISIARPSAWRRLTASQDQNIQAAVQAKGVEPDVGRQTLLLMNSTPEPHAAQLRIKLTDDPDPAADVVLEVANDESILQMWTDQLRGAFESSALVKIVEMPRAKVVRLANRPAIHFQYTRKDPGAGPDWRVDQYKIPLGTKMLHLTTSFSTLEGEAYSPILQSVLASLKAPNDC